MAFLHLQVRNPPEKKSGYTTRSPALGSKQVDINSGLILMYKSIEISLQLPALPVRQTVPGIVRNYSL